MTEKKKIDGWAIVGKVVTFILLLAFIAIIRGAVLSVLWGWFIEPLGVPAINVAGAIGIAVIVAMLTQRKADAEEEKKPAMLRITEAVTIDFFGAAFALLIGYVVHLFL